MKMPKIETYKGIDINYNTENGKLYFSFEGQREVKYLFEAKQIIDEPKWEDCDLKGFYLDYSLDYYIGLAKANRKDVKSGRPDWKYKGRYSVDYRPMGSWQEDKTIVYPVNDKTKAIYQEWQTQRDVAIAEQRKAAKRNKQLHGKDFFQNIGLLGGKKSRGGGFASMPKERIIS